ncbi:TIM barrel protein [Gammaproteobacteria bacterium]|nr:TIM barrel protein [Gammaproteobacteria bacterium]
MNIFININNIKHPIYISTGALSRKMSVDEMIPRLIENKVFNLELASGAKFEDSAFLEKASTKMNFMVHNYFPVPKKPSVLNTAIDSLETHEFVERSLSFSKLVKSPLYSVHAGYVTRFTDSQLGNVDAQRKLAPVSIEGFEQSYKEFVDCAAKIIERAKRLNLEIFFENNGISSNSINSLDKAPRSHLVRIEDYLRFSSDLPQSKILYDVAHAKISANAFQESQEQHFNEFSRSIRAFHLSENDGVTDTNDPIHEDAWFLPNLRKFLRSAKVPIPIVLEVYDISLNEIQEQITLVHKLLQD